MPSFNFECPKCLGRQTLLLRAEPKAPPRCFTCGGVTARDRGAPGRRVLEVLDSGSMSRVVERPADAERIFRERSRTLPERKW